MPWTPEVIAPCGAICTICLAYLRDKNRCPGCLILENGGTEHRLRCMKKNCEQHKIHSFVYCFECEKFPCYSLRKLDERYRINYQMSLIENLKIIQTKGFDIFIKEQEENWCCPSCGTTLCVHRKNCLNCKQSYR